MILLFEAYGNNFEKFRRAIVFLKKLYYNSASNNF
jgi:hypothetical protein